MRITIFLYFVIAATIMVSCSKSSSLRINDDTTVIYLVRHAEKTKEKTSDPALTPEGEARALRLAQLLSPYRIDEVYSTDFQRTRLTAKPIADKAKVSVSIYDHRNPDELAERLRLIKGKHILVTGHSNSTPDMVNRIIGEQKYEQLDESQYNMIYRVTIKDGLFTSEMLTYDTL